MNPSPSLPASDLREVLDQTGPLWTGTSGERWFMTGGTGFVGRWMLGTLLAAIDTLALRISVTLLTRDPTALAPALANHPALLLLRGDVAGFSFPAGRFDRIIHLAKEPDPPAHDGRSAAAGTARVLEFAESCGARSLLFTSSGAVYGPQPPHVERLGEDSPQTDAPEAPHAAYARGKREAEARCLAAAGGDLHVVIARCFSFVGPFMDFTGPYAVGNFIRDAVLQDAVCVEGDGTPLRSYLYSADLAVWLWTLLFRGESAVPYNVGSPDAVSIADLAHLVARTVGGGLPVRILGSSRPGALPARYIPDVGRAGTLGLRPTVPLEQALLKTGDWLRRRSTM